MIEPLDHDAGHAAAAEIPPSRQETPSGYVDYVARALEGQVAELGRSWARRGAAAFGSTPADGTGPVADMPVERAPTEDIVRVLVAAAAKRRGWQDRVMRSGWTAGMEAFQRHASLHQLLKELDAAVALIFRAVHVATFVYTGEASARDALSLVRRINDAATLVRLAAAGGYTRDMSDDLRTRYRMIRHDLRNPLGTITTAVQMMDDETLPEATRQNPRVRAMVARNARSMDAMISSVLGDAAAKLPALALQTTTLRTIACAVRGDLSASVDRIDVVVGDGLPTFPLESAGLELLLKAVVLAIAHVAGPGAEIVIELAELRPRSATVAVFAPLAGVTPRPATPDLSFARELVARLGGRVSAGDGLSVLVEIPLEPIDEASPADQRHDVARQGERPHDEARAL